MLCSPRHVVGREYQDEDEGGGAAAGRFLSIPGEVCADGGVDGCIDGCVGGYVGLA
jgi:hypothetical protein